MLQAALRFVLYGLRGVPMAKVKFDGVIEAVRYNSDGQINWVRAYERRGPTFSDRVLIDRSSLIERLKARKRFVIGQRKPQWASTFDTASSLQLIQRGGRELIVTGATSADHDSLDGAPLI
jgi:hypothetical protein